MLSEVHVIDKMMLAEDKLVTNVDPAAGWMLPSSSLTASTMGWPERVARQSWQGVS